MTRHAPFIAASLATAFFTLSFATTNAQQTTETTAGTLATSDLFSGLDLPLSLKPQQMSSQWRQVVVGDPSQSSMQAMMFGQSLDTPVYYTRGQTASIGRETYLVAYRVKPDPNTLLTRRRRRPDDSPLIPKLAFDARLSLALLNLRTIGNLENVRAFDSQTDIENPQDREARFYEQSVSNLKQIGLALAQYMGDWNGVFPSMKSARSLDEIRNGFNPPPPSGANATVSTTNVDNRNAPVQLVLAPYARDPEIFRHPGTKEIYRPNLYLSRKTTYLSRKTTSAIGNLSKMVTFYEARPSLDGRRAVLYADGHVKRELETDWPRIKKASHIP